MQEETSEYLMSHGRGDSRGSAAPANGVEDTGVCSMPRSKRRCRGRYSRRNRYLSRFAPYSPLRWSRSSTSGS